MQYIVGTAMSKIILPYIKRTGLYIAQETLKSTLNVQMFDANMNFVENWGGNVVKDFLAKGFLGASGYFLFDKIVGNSKPNSELKINEIDIKKYDLSKVFATLVMFLFYFTGEKDVFDYVKTNLKQDIKMSKDEEEIRESEIALGIVNAFEENESNVAGDWTLYQSIVKKFYKEEIETSRPTFSYMYYFQPYNLKKYHPVRMLFSVFVGLSISISNFFGLKHKKGSSSIQIYKLVLYFEVLAHLLKLHNMAPLYNIVTQLKKYVLSTRPAVANEQKPMESNFKSVLKLYPSNPWTS
jgi:hypothetical protein